VARAFADTFHWIALADRRDAWHATARRRTAGRGPDGFVTTDEVLIEFLTVFAEQGPRWRESAVRLVQAVFDSPEVEVVSQSRDSFRAGLDVYSRRPDKGYSLTDCVSMSTMRRLGLTEVLSHDHHFAQKGSCWCTPARPRVDRSRRPWERPASPPVSLP
jgi:predicted nucleic acid-binding protein